jgi:peptide chain release factor 2
MLDELKEEINKLKEKTKDLGNILKVQDKKKGLGELEREVSDPKLWENPERARKLMQEKKVLEREVGSWEELLNSLEDLGTLIEVAKEEDFSELKKELEDLKKKYDSLELSTILGGEYDKNNAILSINAGAGGTDAQDWAQILLRMYSRWAESKEYKVEIPEISYGEAGLKSVTLIISGIYAYGYLKTEVGIHRLVRISPFSSEGKRHTSFAAVEVIPETAEEIEVAVNPSDLRVDTYRASGPGGQHVNKTDSAVRITHIPTGIVAQSQSDRSQRANRESAMKILKARLHEMLLEQRKEKIEELRGEKKKIEWGNQIRSYVFQPYTMVKDHRTGVEIGNVQGVIDGDLDDFIEAVLRRGITKTPQ